MKTKMLYLVFLSTGLIYSNLCIGQMANDSKLAQRAYTKLNSAGTLNGISLGFGLASNIEMAIVGGFPLEYEQGHNPFVNISHAILCTGRLSFSIFPPVNVANARKVLTPWRKSPEMASSCKKLFSYMDAAQVLTAVAPVLSVAGGIMMFVASTGKKEYSYIDDHDYYKYKKSALKTAGWICVGAGLAASISASVMIGLSKKELSKKMGTLKVTASPSGLGLIYNLPGRK